MVNGKIKQNLLNEIRKFGNVCLSCQKIGFNRSTYYRWKEKDENFKKKADEAESMGRENICDVSEHALMINIKKGNQRAIEYALNHNSAKYKQKYTSDVVILHKREGYDKQQAYSFDDMLHDLAKRNYDHNQRLQEEFTTFGGVIPNKPNGKPIEMHELSSYEGYIRDWQKMQKSKNRSTDTADLMTEKDKPSTTPEVNQTISDTSNSDSSKPCTLPDNNI